MIEPVLNERSVEPTNVPTLERVMSLVGVLSQLDALGFPRVLRHTREALSREVEANLSLRDWLFQKAPRDLRQRLGGYLQKAPFVEELHERQEDVRRSLLHVTHLGQPAIGAGMAFLNDSPAVALPGVPTWEVDPLVLLLATMDEETETLEERPVEVIHLSMREQVEARAESLRDRVLRAVREGNELWQRKQEIFPRLDFCLAVERQLRGLTGNEFFFHQVVMALSRLDKALAEWMTGPLHPQMTSSGESSSTLTHGVYGPMRDFVCPDGVERRFSNHLKLFSNNWRIYYWEARADDGGGRAFIGYVGEHLPTVKYRT